MVLKQSRSQERRGETEKRMICSWLSITLGRPFLFVDSSGSSNTSCSCNEMWLKKKGVLKVRAWGVYVYTCSPSIHHSKCVLQQTHTYIHTPYLKPRVSCQVVFPCANDDSWEWHPHKGVYYINKASTSSGTCHYNTHDRYVIHDRPSFSTHTSNACNLLYLFFQNGTWRVFVQPMRSIMHQTSLLERRNAHWKVLHHVSYAR